MLVTTPQGESEVKVTVDLILLDVLFVTIAITPTVVPGAVIVGVTLMLSPKSDDCAVTGAGTKSMDKQKVATTPLIR